MELIGGKFCIDRYEASTVEIRDDGSTAPHSPFLPVTGLRVRAVSKKSVVPQAYISRNESEAACKEAGKRLCADNEWVTACKGPAATKYPYGDERKAGYCVDTQRVSPLNRLFLGLGGGRYLQEPMNDPRLNQVPGTLAATGSFSRCTNGFHVYDMVGNVHEWTADPNGTFRGGYYLDTRINGEGCEYRTVAHPASYHDYSTGFRCCADPH
jgi:formylglycine-generating enzyme required for sulfatase activity